MKKIENDDNLFLIGISGFATCGKDTFAKVAKDILNTDGNFNSHILNLAHDLKDIANLIVQPFLGLDCHNVGPEDKKRLRTVLVGIGEGFRAVDPMFWVKRVADKILKLDLNKKTFIFVPDIRNPCEAEWIHQHKHGIVISITRENIIAPNTHELENIPAIREKYADFRVTLPNIDIDAENILTNPQLRGIVSNILGEIHG